MEESPTQETYIHNNNKNQYNQSNQSHQVSEEDEKRVNCSFYMLPSIAEAFRIYAHKIPKVSVGVNVEKAFTDYMINHPINNFSVVIQQKIVDEASDKRRDIKVKALTLKIKRCLDILKTIRKNNGSNESKYEERLLDLLVKGTDINNPPTEFIQLLEEAASHV